MPPRCADLEQRRGAWSVAESDNFRIFHQQNRELAERVATVAERTRRDMGRKWFGEDGEWPARCDIYLHATAEAYSRATGKPPTWTAHSTINLEAGRVVLRRIDVRGDDAELLTASLPHETTHAVLAGHFGKHHVPRWADEGMALLSEPDARLDVYRRKLDEAQRGGLLFPLHNLMTLEDYPTASRAFAFYVQSVSVTDYLVKQPGGAQAFSRFVNEALRTGYDAAAQKVYGLDMNTLQQRWREATFGEPVAARDQKPRTARSEATRSKRSSTATQEGSEPSAAYSAPLRARLRLTQTHPHHVALADPNDQPVRHGNIRLWIGELLPVLADGDPASFDSAAGVVASFRQPSENE